MLAITSSQGNTHYNGTEVSLDAHWDGCDEDRQ